MGCKNRNRVKERKCTFRFTNIREVEIFLVLESIDCQKSFGFDKIHPLLLSSAAVEIFEPVTNKINLTIKQGIFPGSLKTAKFVLSQSSNSTVPVPYVRATDPHQSFLH